MSVALRRDGIEKRPAIHEVGYQRRIGKQKHNELRPLPPRAHRRKGKHRSQQHGVDISAHMQHAPHKRLDAPQHVERKHSDKASQPRDYELPGPQRLGKHEPSYGSDEYVFLFM